VIIDLDKFVARERPYWRELEQLVAELDPRVAATLDLRQAQRLHYLYERASAALARIDTFSTDEPLRQYLQSVVARAYSAIHSAGAPRRRIRPIRWFFGTLPGTFRRHGKAYATSVAATLAGCLLGAILLSVDPQTKEVLFSDTFSHLRGDPAERVRQEESGDGRHGGETQHAAFATMLMTHNTRVSIIVLALGLTWGAGTIVMLFYNGVILGVVITDYIWAGQGVFLAGWLLPHGVIEIPAILIAGQAGLLLGSTLIGRGDRNPLKVRLRAIAPDLMTLIMGVAVLLVWAGIVESFFSQFHQPAVPYWLKISFGLIELGLLVAFLAFSGRRAAPREDLA
jgi:uncharacterized membrane protein SpoIIM required for sporulation